MRNIRLLIADENPIARSRIIASVKSHPAVEVVGEAASGREALSKASTVNPDVVLVNIRSILDTGWLDFVERLARESPTVRAVLTGHGNDTEHLGSMLESAASATEQLVSKPSGTRGPPSTGGSLLSPREHQVLLLLAEGYTNREIAERIFRSVKTVEAYRAHIKKKLGLRNRADIVHYVQSEGLLNRTT